MANLQALLATGVNSDLHREISAVHVASGEDGAGWLGFFRDLTARGPTGKLLSTSPPTPAGHLDQRDVARRVLVTLPDA